MQFRNGRHAIQYYAEFLDQPVRNRTMTAFVCEDEGAHIGYDSNSIPGDPDWALRVETLADLEKMFSKALSRRELAFAMYYCRIPLHEVLTDNDIVRKRTLTRMHTFRKLKDIYRKIERQLRKNDYLEERFTKEEEACPQTKARKVSPISVRRTAIIAGQLKRPPKCTRKKSKKGARA